MTDQSAENSREQKVTEKNDDEEFHFKRVVEEVVDECVVCYRKRNICKYWECNIHGLCDACVAMLFTKRAKAPWTAVCVSCRAPPTKIAIATVHWIAEYTDSESDTRRQSYREYAWPPQRPQSQTLYSEINQSHDLNQVLHVISDNVSDVLNQMKNNQKENNTKFKQFMELQEVNTVKFKQFMQLQKANNVKFETLIAAITQNSAK